MSKKKKETLPLKYHWKNFTYGTARNVKGLLGFVTFATMAGGLTFLNVVDAREQIDHVKDNATSIERPTFDVDTGTEDAELRANILNLQLDDLIEYKVKLVEDLQEAPVTIGLNNLADYTGEKEEEYKSRSYAVLADIIADTDLSEVDFQGMYQKIAEHDLQGYFYNAQNGGHYNINLTDINPLSLRECQTKETVADRIDDCMRNTSDPVFGAVKEIKSKAGIKLGFFLTLLLGSYLAMRGGANKRINKGRPHPEQFRKPSGN